MHILRTQMYWGGGGRELYAALNNSLVNEGMPKPDTKLVQIYTDTMLTIQIYTKSVIRSRLDRFCFHISLLKFCLQKLV